jgi:hypothetical protein
MKINLLFSCGFWRLWQSLRMSNVNRNQLILREIELRNQFAKMTSEEIRKIMNTTDNTTTRLICWEYLQTL